MITSGVRCNVRIVYDKRIDIVVRDNICDDLLIFLSHAGHWSSRLMTLRLARLRLLARYIMTGRIDRSCGRTAVRSFLRYCTLENDLSALSCIMF